MDEGLGLVVGLIQVNCCNYRKNWQAKVAECAWAKNGKRSDVRFCPCGHTDAEPPVERQHPPHHVIVVELGKPNVFPCGWAAGV